MVHYIQTEFNDDLILDDKISGLHGAKRTVCIKRKVHRRGNYCTCFPCFNNSSEATGVVAAARKQQEQNSVK